MLTHEPLAALASEAGRAEPSLRAELTTVSCAALAFEPWTRHTLAALNWILGCALFPPADVAAPLAAIRARFDVEHAAKIVPHITLKQGFHGPAPASAAERTLVEELLAVARGHAPLPVALDEVGCFGSPSYGYVVYARVCGGAELHSLSAQLTHAVARLGYETPGMSAEHESELFFPHLTLAQGLSEAAATAMRAELTWRPVQFQARRFGIGRCAADGVWSTPFECALGGVRTRSASAC